MKLMIITTASDDACPSDATKKALYQGNFAG